MLRGLAAASASVVLALGADFDGDGYDDLAVGSPGEDEGSVADLGYVNVRYGSASSLTAAGAQKLTQALAGDATEAGDRFGAALGTGDFDGDGFFDVAFGAPGEDDGSLADLGHVNALHGRGTLFGRFGLAFSQGTTAGFNESGDQFGAALP